jgi:hypothetical protein
MVGGLTTALTAAPLLAWAACSTSSGRSEFSFGDASTTSHEAAQSAGTLANSESGGCAHLNIGILGNPGFDMSANFRAWLVSAGTSVRSIETDASSETLTASALAPFDVVVINYQTHHYSEAEAAAFSAWFTAGGGVVSMTGFTDLPANDWLANPLLETFGIEYGAADGGLEVNGPVTGFATSPVTNGLTSVTFNEGWEVLPVLLDGSSGTRTPVAFITPPDGAAVPVAYTATLGMGHAFVWGDDWIQYDSE